MVEFSTMKAKLEERIAAQPDRTSPRRREKGSGSLYKSGRYWHARWVVDGRAFHRSTRRTVHSEAVAVLADFVAPFRARSEARRLEALQARIDTARREAARLEAAANSRLLRVDGLAEAYRRSARRRDCGPETLARYLAQIGEFAAFMREEAGGAVAVRDVTRAHADAFLERLSASGASPNTYNKRIVLFRSVWRVLGREAGCRDNPWDGAEKRRLDTQVRRALSPQEIDAVLAAASGELRDLLRIGLFTGLRLGDAALLRWDAVDQEQKVLRVRPRKTSRSTGVTVEIPLFPELQDALDGMRSAAGQDARTGFVMPGIAEKYRRDQSKLSARIGRLFRACGIATSAVAASGRKRRTVASFHSLRHTFVSICAAKGVPLTVVQSIVGHSTVRMTEYYAHADRAVAMRELTRAFRARPKGR